ncbi:MAG: branched-chain amino acid ABC transporter permease [Bradyrhizobiaceae bacterium]|nr:branched-chain amino acid ABC transporter permease [Bradyrhizobiaceae bacterium]
MRRARVSVVARARRERHRTAAGQRGPQYRKRTHRPLEPERNEGGQPCRGKEPRASHHAIRRLTSGDRRTADRTRSVLGSGLLSAHDAGMIGVVLILLVLLYGFFRYTRVGLAMRAAAANPESARLVGVRVGWMLALGWGLAAAIGAVAGMLIAPVVFLEPNMMLSILLYGFAGAVVGGITSPAGAVLGGFAVGIVENLAGTFIPYVGREMKLSIALALIIAVLMVRPSGLFGRKIVSRV